MKSADFIIKYRRYFIIIVNLLLIVLSYITSFFIRFEFNLEIVKNYWDIILITLPLLIAIKLVVFNYFGLFSGLWRYVSIDDLWRMIKANSVSTVIFILAMVFFHGLIGFPRSIFILDWILSLIFLGGIRLMARSLREIFPPSYTLPRKRALIIGAGQAGILMLKECKTNPKVGLNIIGFIDDDPVKRGKIIHGVKVLGGREEIPEVVSKYEIEEIILAIPSAKGKVIRNILSYCQLPNVKVKIIPGLHKIISGELEVKPREIKPEDLLGREEVLIFEEEVQSYLGEKRILVTGAGGSIGSEICRQIANFKPKQLLLIDHNENDLYFLEVELKRKYPNIEIVPIIGDIKDIRLLKQIFSKYLPHIVFHSAAYKHVPLMEKNPIVAVQNNIIGTRNLIYAADHYKVERFVLISTDKAVRPNSVMGMTKRIAEIILQAKAKKSKTKFMAVRFGNVIGSKGSVVPLFKKQIEEGGPVTVTHPEAKRYFMSVKEAVALILQAGIIGQGGEIFILDMGEQIKIIDLAKNLIILSGLKPYEEISIEFIGLRPGEKLSEELFLETEKDNATKHDKIYITKPENFNLSRVRRQIKELERLTNLWREEEVIKKMEEIISSLENGWNQK